MEKIAFLLSLTGTLGKAVAACNAGQHRLGNPVASPHSLTGYKALIPSIPGSALNAMTTVDTGRPFVSIYSN